jgi:hypothetical protein
MAAGKGLYAAACERNLMLARASARQQEIAIRLALGARRIRLTRPAIYRPDRLRPRPAWLLSGELRG